MNISDKSKEIMANCRFCWMCRHVCPIGNATGLERNTAKSRALGASLVVSNTIELKEVADNMYQRSELDYLIYNAPLEYADLILNGDPETYLKTVTEYKPLDS